MEWVDLVTFGNARAGDEVNSLEFGLKVLNAGLQTVIVPVVLTVTTPTPPRRQAVPGNVLPAAPVVDKARSNGWVSRVHSATSRTLRRLMTQALSRQRS